MLSFGVNFLFFRCYFDRVNNYCIVKEKLKSMTYPFKLKTAFDEITDKVLFKGNAVDDIKRVALETVAAMEQEFERVKKALVEKLAYAEEDFVDVQVGYKAERARTAALQKKLAGVIEKGNAARKSAAARANRYKSKYEHLLDDIETVLPGAKALLTSRAISAAEKAKRLAQLDATIARQRDRVGEHVGYDAVKRRDVFLSGYGRQCRVLGELLKRKKQLENQKSY